MANWYAYKRISSGVVEGFTTDDAQGFAQLQANPAFSLHPIPGQPTADQTFDHVDNTVKTLPKPDATARVIHHAFQKPNPAPSNKEIMDGLRVIYDLLTGATQ